MKHHATSCNNGHRYVLASMIRTYHSHSRITTFHHVIHSYMPIHNKTLLTCRSCSMQKRDESREDFAFVESGGTLRRELPALLGHGWCSGGFSHCDNLACPESCVTFCNPMSPACPILSPNALALQDLAFGYTGQTIYVSAVAAWRHCCETL